MIKKIFYFHVERSELQKYLKPNLTTYLKHLLRISSMVVGANLSEQYLYYYNNAGASPSVAPFEVTCFLEDLDRI